MNKQKLIGVISAIIVVGGTILLVALISEQNTVNNLSALSSPVSPVSNVVQKNSTKPNNQILVEKPVVNENQYTLSQVAVHAGASSCWSAINGNVYDLTAWISPHPGGSEAILSVCGKDGTDSFNSQHSGSSRILKILGSFKIGTLK